MSAAAGTAEASSDRAEQRAGPPAGPAATPDPVVRELGAGEVGVVEAVFEGLTPVQRYHRFHTGVARLTRVMLDQLSRPDGTRHVALVAFAADRPVGLARYVCTEPSRAEVAVEVVADYTRRGVGRSLLRQLRGHAAAHGVTRLDVIVTADNRAALGLARAFGVRVVPNRGGYAGTLYLTPPLQLHEPQGAEPRRGSFPKACRPPHGS